jgi:SAM-dependent methyltransferase
VTASLPVPDYDRIGRGYRRHRVADPRIASSIARAMGDARTVVDVGAGTGSYEPPDRLVVAVEPSAAMLAQHPGRRRIRARAEALPFDAALVSLTLHHWADWRAGVAEIRRVSRRQVIFTFDPHWAGEFWLVDEYFPEELDLGTSRAPAVADLADALGGARIETVPIPWDCTDGFQAAYWRRPEMYLDPGVRACISTMQVLPPAVVERAIRRLADDVDSGAWRARHADLLERESMDFGYRLVVGGD